MKRFGIALSSGGARGFAHIGVLQELEKNNISPDFVAGTSMGAIIGALYCSGMSPFEIEKLVKSEEWKRTLRPAFSKSGLVNGEKIREYLKRFLKRNFKNLERNFLCVATNIKTGNKVVFSSGNLVNAVYASMAVPGIFTPLEYKGMVLIDGGLVEPVPSIQLHERGIDYIAAVDLSIEEGSANLTTGESFGFGRDFMEHIKNTWLTKRGVKETTENKEEKKHFRLPQVARKAFRKESKKTTGEYKKEKSPNAFDILKGTMYIMSNQIAVEQAKNGPHHLVIKPGLSRISLINSKRIDDILKAGRLAAARSIPRLKRLRQHRPSHQE